MNFPLCSGLVVEQLPFLERVDRIVIEDLACLDLKIYLKCATTTEKFSLVKRGAGRGGISLEAVCT